MIKEVPSAGNQHVGLCAWKVVGEDDSSAGILSAVQGSRFRCGQRARKAFLLDLTYDLVICILSLAWSWYGFEVTRWKKHREHQPHSTMNWLNKSHSFFPEFLQIMRKLRLYSNGSLEVALIFLAEVIWAAFLRTYLTQCKERKTFHSCVKKVSVGVGDWHSG